jgi:hypothetical protein
VRAPVEVDPVVRRALAIAVGWMWRTREYGDVGNAGVHAVD